MQRKIAAIAILAGAALVAGPAVAADPIDEPVYKDYVPPHVPEVDDGLKGSFYLRGSAAGNVGTALQVNHPSLDPSEYDVDEMGYGYSAGIGAGYETGDGLRFDVTVDHLQNDGMATEIENTAPPGTYELNLRSTIALANVYYDFGLGDGGLSAAGGMFGYVGAGAGVAFNRNNASWPDGTEGAWDGNTSFAAAGMAGVGYDFGDIVADLGYRGLYINSITNDEAISEYSIDHAMIHEIRASLRYRFN